MLKSAESKVSIIIPTFNSLKYIHETIESVLKQTYANIEIIIIDDGSTDGSWDYLKSLRIEHLLVVKNEGSGACAARNHGYKLSCGNYIQFLDSDDLLSPDKIEKQVALLDQNLDYIAVCSTKHFYDLPENGKITDTDFMFSTDQPSQFLLNLYGANGRFEMVQTSAWLTPRNVIDKAGIWNASLTKDQDGEFFCRVVMASKGVVYVPNVLNYYRKHVKGSNIANQVQRQQIESQLQAVNLKALVLSPQSDTSAYKSAMALQYKFIAINAYPQFKDISSAAMKISDSLGGSSYLPILGGRLIEFLKFTFGWKLAKSVKIWVNSNFF